MDPTYQMLLEYLKKLGKLPYKGVLITLALTFVFATSVAFLAYHFTKPDINLSVVKKSAYKPTLPKQKSTLTSSQVKQIINRNIFNKEGKVPDEDTIKEKTVYDDQVPIKSKLPLQLMGTIYGGDPYSGLAVIQDSGTKKQNSFMVGDMVLKGVELIEVYRQKIIVEVDDHKEYVELEENIIDRDKRKRRSKGKKSSSSRGGAGAVSEDKFSEEGFERDGTSVVMSKDYKQKLLTQDFAKVLQDAKAEPFYEDGELSGFRLDRIKSNSIYEKAGLRNSDVIKEINGVSLVDTAQTIKLLNSLRGESQIDFSLVRGGQKVNINMQVK